jgi:tetratricopeptide (TPR) repeat protein
MTWRLEAGSDLVVQLHLQPTGKPEPVQVSAGFYFTNEEPTRAPVGLRLGQQTIDISPGQSGYVVTDDYVLPVNAEVHAVQPHAHNLGRHIEGTATLPDGSTRSLVSIADWDFRWQNVYRYATPFVLPKGTKLSMRFSYDNSDANPRNPHRPAARVVWGQNTADEMGDLWVQLVATRSQDHAVLNGDVARKIRRQDLDAYTKLQKEEPLNPIRHAAVAMVLLQDGRAQEAIAPFRESIRLGPSVASTHYNLGVALASVGQLPPALEAFREAVRLDQSYPEAHNNLGALLQSDGRVDEAMAHYRQALAARPDNVEARTNLARALKLQGQVAEAASHYVLALESREDWPAALFGLAWIRATASDDALRRPEEAVTLATRAAALTNERDPYVLDALAAAYAATGAFGKAASVARAARQIAQVAGLTPLAAAIDTRVALYQRHEAYRERPR